MPIIIRLIMLGVPAAKIIAKYGKKAYDAAKVAMKSKPAKILGKYKIVLAQNAAIAGLLGAKELTKNVEDEVFNPQKDKKRKERTKSRLAQRTGSQYTGKYSKGGGVRPAKYKV